MIDPDPETAIILIGQPMPRRALGRPFAGDSDLPSLARLLVACSANQYGEHYTLHFFGLARRGNSMRSGWHARLWEATTSGEERDTAIQVVACALVAGTSLHFHISPAARGTVLEDQLMDWIERRGTELARERGAPITFSVRCAENDDYRRALLERYGFARTDKHLLQMARPLTQPLPEPRVPDGYAIRRLRPDGPEQELAAFAAAYNAAMGGGATNAQDWHERASDPHNPPPIGLIAPDGRFGAVCVCRIYRAHNETFGVREGWIDQMGTREELRRQGLGRAVLRAGLRGLRDRGADTAVLETGSTNRRSQPLYDSEGFVTRTRVHSFRKTLPHAQPTA